MNKPAVIQKLTEEEIESKEIQVENLKLNIELAKTKVKQFTKMLNNDYFTRKAKVDLDELEKEIKTQERNIKAMEEQIKTGAVTM